LRSQAIARQNAGVEERDDALGCQLKFLFPSAGRKNFDAKPDFSRGHRGREKNV
jgi:hypothetical protein